MPDDLPELEPAEPSEPRDVATLPLIFGTVAVLALAVVLSIAALVAADDDTSGGTGTASSAHVSLTEFAITPDAVTVSAGGTVHITNDGTAVHNLAVTDTDLKTPDIAAGETGELDVSSLEPGSYELLCLIPGHADSGMTASLQVVEGGGDVAAGGETDRHHPRRRPRRDGLRPDDRGHAGVLRRVPGRDRGAGQPAPRAHRGEGRRHQGVRPHHGGSPLGGVPGQGRRRDDLQRHGPRPADGPGGGRQGRGAGPERPGDRHRRPLPRPQRRERERRRGAAHPGPHRARRLVHLQVHDRRAGRGHVPPACPRPPAAPRRDVRGRARGRPPPAHRQDRGLRADPGLGADQPADPDGAQRLRGDRAHAQRQELPGHPALHGQGRRLGAHRLLERGQPDPPDAPAPVRPGRGGQGRVPRPRAVRRRHAERRPG